MSESLSSTAYIALVAVLLTAQPLIQDLSGNAIIIYVTEKAKNMYCSLPWEPCHTTQPNSEVVRLIEALRSPGYAEKLAYVRHSGAAAVKSLTEIGSRLTSVWTSAIDRFNYVTQSVVKSLNERLLTEETKKPSWYCRMLQHLQLRSSVCGELDDCHRLTGMFKGRCVRHVFINHEIANPEMLYSFSPTHRALYMLTRKMLISLTPYIIQLCVFGLPSLALIYLIFKLAFKRYPTKELPMNTIGKGDCKASDREKIPKRSRFLITFVVLIVATVLAISSGFLTQDYGTTGLLVSGKNFGKFSISDSEDENVDTDDDGTWLPLPFSYLLGKIGDTFYPSRNKPVSVLENPACHSALALLRFDCLRETLFVMEGRHLEEDLELLSPLHRSAYLKTRRFVINITTIVVISMELAVIIAAIYLVYPKKMIIFLKNKVITAKDARVAKQPKPKKTKPKPVDKRFPKGYHWFQAKNKLGFPTMAANLKANRGYKHGWQMCN